MKLTDDQLEAIFEELDLPREGRALVRKIRSSPPARRVNKGSSRTGRFPSAKMGLTIQYESGTLTAPACRLYEASDEIVEFYDEPFALSVPYERLGSTRDGITHTPDYFVIRRTLASDGSAGWSLGFDEWRFEARMQKLQEGDPIRYARLASGRWGQPPVAEYLAALGLDYQINTEADIPGALVRNETLLADFDTAPHAISAQVAERIAEAIELEPGCSLKELLTHLDDVKVEDVLWLIKQQTIWTDLRSALLTNHDDVKLYSSPQLATRLEGPAIPIERGEVIVEVGARVRFADAEYVIQGITPEHVFLGADNQPGLKLAMAAFEKYRAEGDIAGISNARPAIAARLLDRRKFLDVAECRYRAIAPYLSGEAAPKDRSQRRWLREYRDAGQLYGDGYVGLLPDILQRGNRTPRLAEAPVALADTLIDEQFLQPKQLSVRKCYALYRLRCEREQVSPMGKTAFFDQLRRRSRELVARKRWGHRAANSAAMRRPSNAIPVSGDYVFARVHLDHTRVDLECVDSATGVNLGRPWLTIAVDGFSHRILAAILLFDSPSSRSDLLIARELVRQYGRLPQVFVIDNGPDFESTYFQKTMAAFQVEMQYKQAGNPRQGSEVENSFKKLCTDLLWNLVGNTKIRKNVRQMSPSADPSAHAIWTLGALSDQIAEYRAWHDVQPIRSLGGSPRQIFERSLQIAGTRAGKLLAYEPAFRALTAFPGPRRGGFARVTREGVQIRNLTYWCEAFRGSGIEDTDVEVRYEPLDARTAYAKVQGRWYVCRAEYRELENRSEREIDTASQELRKRLGKDPSMLAIALHLEEAQKREAELLLAKNEAGKNLRRAAEQGALVARIDPPVPDESSEDADARPTEAGAIEVRVPERYRPHVQPDDEAEAPSTEDAA